jgi:hypothetical protein
MPVTIQLIIALVLLALLPGCSRLTMENYAKIKPGIGYSEAVRILGKPDTCSEALIVKNCVWGDEKKNIKINFAGDKAILYTSNNLK